MSKKYKSIDYHNGYEGEVYGYLWEDLPENAEHFNTIQNFLNEHEDFFVGDDRIELVLMTQEEADALKKFDTNSYLPRITFVSTPLSTAAATCIAPEDFLEFVQGRCRAV